MSTTLEAESDTAAEEAAAAIEAEDQAALEAHAAKLEARAASGEFEESADTGMTQAEREAASEFDTAPSGSPAAAAEESAAKKRKRAPKPAQGTLDGAWEALIGGEQPSESKVKIAGGAIQPTNSPEKILKGTRHRVLVDLVATGYASNDKLDHATGEISSTTETRTLKIVGATFLAAEEWITDADPQLVEKLLEQAEAA